MYLTFSAEFEQKCKGNQDQLEADTNRLKEILKRENEERKNELRELEAFTKKENAERKAETEQINNVLNAENDKRMKEAQALKDKMEKEKKELQAYLEKVKFHLLLSITWYYFSESPSTKLVEYKSLRVSNGRVE